ncbi:MAG: hypothetical protein IPM55_13205 [Acidobacteria bacterium]|nr:hypothetical protein [Acidobacteriota bacterium]
MTKNNIIKNFLFIILALAIYAAPALAAEPEMTVTANDDKPGSLLFYNIYSSNASSPDRENTRINITNTNGTTGVAMHLFFVDGSTCTVADGFLCLLPMQTTSFSISEIDPGVTGYLVVLAVDGPAGMAGGTNTGSPVKFNYLIGDEYVKLASGHQAGLGAVSYPVVEGDAPPVMPVNNEPFATLVFDGKPGNYVRAPRMVAIANLLSPNVESTLLVLNRFGGDLSSKALSIGSVFGLMYNDETRTASFSFSSGSCQFRGVISSSFPRTAPRANVFIPEGRVGWMKFYGQSASVGLSGSVLISSLFDGPSSYQGGHNLHTLTLTDVTTYTVPVFPPSC